MQTATTSQFDNRLGTIAASCTARECHIQAADCPSGGADAVATDSGRLSMLHHVHVTTGMAFLHVMAAGQFLHKCMWSSTVVQALYWSTVSTSACKAPPEYLLSHIWYWGHKCKKSICCGYSFLFTQILGKFVCLWMLHTLTASIQMMSPQQGEWIAPRVHICIHLLQYGIWNTAILQGGVYWSRR